MSQIFDLGPSFYFMSRLCSVNMDGIIFISQKISIKILFFHFYFLNQDP